MAVSSIGVGSGLPLEELLNNLRNSENNALVLIQSKQINAEQRLSAYGTLKNALEELNKAGQALGKAETMGALKTSVTGDSFTASSTSAAIPGKYNVVVNQLATSQSLVATRQSDRTATIGTGGVITFKTDSDAEPKTLDLTGKGTSLNDIVAAINGDPKLGINATVVNDGDTFQLVLTTAATGAKAALTEISVAGNDNLRDVMGFGAGAPPAPASGMQLTGPPAQNALITVNGIEVKSQTNVVENVLDGVTLTLNKADAADATGNSLSITRDDASTTKAINAFVTAYNSLQGTIKTLTSYNADAQKSSALTGDSLARQMQNQVRSVLNVSGESGDIRSLAQLGISTDPATGLLKVDNDKL
ncbi:MAG TPA: flagellar filament capping protein FliD, partial [Eoetvoesiella sp.]